MTTHPDKVVYGNRPNGVYVPRFRNLNGQDEGVDFIRGYGYQGSAMRSGWQGTAGHTPGFGKDFKTALRQPAPWTMTLTGFGECLPYKSNSMQLHTTKRDRFGIPQVSFDFSFGDNENKMRADIMKQAEEMLQKAGAAFVQPYNKDSVPREWEMTRKNRCSIAGISLTMCRICL